MAAIGKIRSWGPVLVSVIALALFAFIAEELFRSCESSRNDNRQQVGAVYGEKINVQDFQKLVDEYTEVIKMQQGQDNLNEQQMNQVKDMVWNSYVQTKLIEHEAKALGLAVTDAELQNILKDGTNPMLMQTPFVNQQTGRFDVNALQKFLADYRSQNMQNAQLAQQYETIYRYWTFIEKTLRQQTLADKYQNLLAHSLLSNPIEAKMSFNAENEESRIQLAAFPYSSIEDNKISVSDEDLKAKYEELKPLFKQYVETRDIKFVDIQVNASDADRKELQKQFVDYAQQLSENNDPAEVVRKTTSLVNYLGIPVAKEAFPADIAQRLDSIAVGTVYGPMESKMDNTLNLIKLLSKQTLPDSVQYRQIQVGGETVEATRQLADSIFTALKNGADFEALAKKYGQTGAKTWLTTRQYQTAPSLDKDTRGYLESLNTMNVNELKNIELSQGNLIVQVVDRRHMITKYTAAVVKKTIDFSKDTYSAAYNKFSSFVSASQNADSFQKSAEKNGYRVQEATDIVTSQHYLAGISSTRDALKWVFEAKEGDISPMYECGENNHLLVVLLNKIHPKGYRTMDDASIKERLKAEVEKDKKAELLMAKASEVKTIEAAKAQGAVVVDSLAQITFAAPVFIAASGASEPVLSGAVSATAKGKFCASPVKGNAGVYVFQVLDKTTRPNAKFDAKTQEAKLRQRAMQNAGNFSNELYAKAKVVDNRYLFF